MEQFTIGKLARESGVGVETARFYERRRLIKKPSVKAVATDSRTEGTMAGVAIGGRHRRCLRLCGRTADGGLHESGQIVGTRAL